MTKNNKITVLFVNPSQGLSGDTQSLVNLIESLKDEIIPIVLLTEKAEAFELFNSIGVECFVHKYLTVLSRPFWSNVKNVITHPWRLRIIKFVRYDLSCLLYIRKVLAGRNIDVVHTNTAPTLMGKRIARMLKLPHIWHIREYVDRDQTNAIIAIGRKKLVEEINNADGRIVVSKTCMKAWGLDKKNTWVILDAVRSKTECCYIKEKQSYVLFCSNYLTEAKGASKAISAFGMSGLYKSSSNESPIRLKMLGNCDADYKKKLLALAEIYGCAEYVDFIPAQKDVKTYFANAKAFIQPSINEGMGRTTAEAMLYGCPVIAHASGGTLDLIKNGETGYLFTTIEECAKLMKMVSHENQENLIYRAQEFAIQNMSVEKYGNKVLEVYNKICKNCRQ